jgi:multicomponent Na+:H+ antiporter subunit G
MGVLEILGSMLLAVGCLLAITGSLGVLRMPDFYSRLHPAGKTDTLGQLLMLSGLMLFAGQKILSLLLVEGGPQPDDSAAMLGWANILLKVVLVAALLFVTAPTSTHAIAKAARLDPHTDIPVDGDPGQLTSRPSEASASVPRTLPEDDITRRIELADMPAMPAMPTVPEREEPR